MAKPATFSLEQASFTLGLILNSPNLASQKYTATEWDVASHLVTTEAHYLYTE
jgi:hypothetical protein